MKNRVMKTALLLTCITFLGKITAFFRETLIATVYGASSVTDAYLVAFSLTNTVFMTFGAAIGTTVIPSYMNLKTNSDIKQTNSYLKSFFSVLILFSLVISLVAVICAPYLIKTLFPNLVQIKLAILLTRILFPTLVLMTINAFITNILNVSKIYLPASFTVLIGNLIVVLFLVLNKNTHSIFPLVWGQVASLIFQVICLIILLLKYKLYIKVSFFKINFNLIQEDVKNMIPIISVTILMQANALVERFLASSLDQGAITQISIAYKITDFLISILITVLGTILYPDFSELHVKKEDIKLSNLLSKSIKIIIIITVPLTAGALLYAHNIVDVLMGYGKFNENNVEYTSKIFLLYSFSISLLVLNSIVTRFLYAVRKNRIVFINQIFYTISNIVLGLIFVQYLQGYGIPIAFSLSTFISLGMLLISIKGTFINFNLKSFIWFISRVIGTTGVMIIVLVTINTFIFNTYIQLFVGVAAGALIYLIMLYALKIEEVREVTRFRKRVNYGVSS
ncbi:murein biosynthesis integral membrane protein MurJ [Priestia aryabhattai]|uniref:murein biosynthesis integral membrane protein MurJ n=1 Tax=Priestia aryabhattai TaxID=412384 RepID=UPI002E1AC8D8|nr:murein biosynthesis integral membrane protein MurJ [Priestia aryabhattai]MED4261165.1 murein biosynthesis integral membrane protein MurJ [Priestia aryabhattai]